MSHEFIEHGLGISSLAFAGSTGIVFFALGGEGECAPDGVGETAFASNVQRVDGITDFGGACWAGSIGEEPR